MPKAPQAKQKIETLPNGSLNPVIETRMERIPWLGVIAAARAMKHGMKYEQKKADNWKGIPAEEHLNHALLHIAKFQAGDRSEDHVDHAVNRILMWADRLEAAKRGLK